MLALVYVLLIILSSAPCTLCLVNRKDSIMVFVELIMSTAWLFMDYLLCHLMSCAIVDALPYISKS